MIRLCLNNTTLRASPKTLLLMFIGDTPVQPAKCDMQVWLVSMSYSSSMKRTARSIPRVLVIHRKKIPNILKCFIAIGELLTIRAKHIKLGSL